MYAPTFIERFWKRVNRKGTTPKYRPELGKCWEWTGCKNPRGYGMCFIPHKPKRGYLTHRIAWELTFGEITDGSHICHHCDNPPCCNPDHLFKGNALSNVRDCIKKGRRVQVRGEQCGAARLSESQILEIRKLRALGESLKTIAAKFGVSPAYVSSIAYGRNWKFLGGVMGKPLPLGMRKARRHLSDEEIHEIFKEYSNGRRQKDLAVEFGVHQCHISRLLNGRGRFSHCV